MAEDENVKEKYINQFNYNSNEHRFTMEASPAYTDHKNLSLNAPTKIYNSGLNPKLIYIVRNPIARIESEYNFMQKSKEWNFAIDSDEVVNVSDYYFHTSRFLKYFSKEDLLILDFENLVKKPDSVLSELYDFIGAGHDFYPKKYHVFNKT